MGWLELLFVCGLAFGVAALLFMRVMSGLGFEELRGAVVNRAYKSFTHEGLAIPGVQPHPGARLVIRLLTRNDDERRQLMIRALAEEEAEQSLPVVIEKPVSA